MPTFGHAAADDPLGLATDDGIVLVDVNEVLNQSIVDVLDHSGVLLTGSGAVVPIEGIYTLTCQYELQKTGGISVALNSDIGTTYRVFGINANCSSRTFPTVSVTALKPGAGSFATVLAAGSCSVAIAGGFGVVNLWGATCASPISSSLSISAQQASAISGTTGVILTAGLAVFGWRKDCTLEGFVAPTLALSGVYESASSEKTSRDGFQIFSKSWRADLAFA